MAFCCCPLYSYGGKTLDFFLDIWNAIDKALIKDNRYEYYLSGISNTLIISLFAVLLGFLIGVLIAVIKFLCNGKKGVGIFAKICDLYVFVIRGTPVLVQLLLINAIFFCYRDANTMLAAIVCFGINSGAYVAEIVRAGIESIDKGQMEAGRSLGLSGIQTMRLIILPQAIKNILPALGNEFIVLVKETSIAGYIAVTDITKAAQYIGSKTYDIITPLLIAAAFYLILVFILTKLQKMLERRLAKSDRR